MGTDEWGRQEVSECLVLGRFHFSTVATGGEVNRSPNCRAFAPARAPHAEAEQCRAPFAPLAPSALMLVG